MNKPKDIDYADYAREHEPELLQAAVDAISPDVMGMDRNQALTLAGAMKNCGFSSADFAAVMARSSADKGTFAKQWDKFRGSGSHGTAGAGTIFDYALKSGWKWPAPDRTAADMQNSAKPKEAGQKPAEDLPALLAKWHDDFKISCIMDSVGYASKPAPKEAQAIRRREQTPTPMPEPMSLQDFAAAVTSGHTFSPTVYNKVQTGTNEAGQPVYTYTPMCQQIFVADIDNEEPALDDAGKPIKGQKKRIENPLTIDSAIEICKKHDIMPFFVYETFSSKEHREDSALPYQKFRLCFALDKPLQVQEWGTYGIGKAISYFIGLFGKAADSKTTDPARLIYGTDEKDRATLYTSIIDSKKFLEKINPAPDPVEDPAEVSKEDYCAAAHIQDFIDGISESANTPATPTGFDNLDELLDGGLYPGLYFIGAISSLGKTTFTMQMADQIAQQGHDVLIFSLEMARSELMAKSISRLTFLYSAEEPRHAKTTRGILSGQMYEKYTPAEKALINKAVQEYYKYAPHIFIIEGVGDYDVLRIKEVIDAHIKKTGQRPVVIIDYVQIIAPLDVRGTDKQNTDKAVLELKRISRDFKIPVVGVSSFNRDNYTAPVNMAAFKESGAVEYSSDVLIGMQYAGMDYQEGESEKERLKRIRKLLESQAEAARLGEEQRIQLKVLKNRNGKKGQRLFEYIPVYNYYYEVDKFGRTVNDPFADVRGKAK